MKDGFSRDDVPFSREGVNGGGGIQGVGAICILLQYL